MKLGYFFHLKMVISGQFPKVIFSLNQNWKLNVVTVHFVLIKSSGKLCLAAGDGLKWT